MSPLLPGIIASGISGHLWTPEGSAYEIAKYTVPTGVSVNAVTFAIPSGYRHLQIIGNARRSDADTANGQSFIRFNGDSTASYSTHIMYGNGSGANPLGGGGGDAVYTYGTPGANQSAFNAFVINITDYSSSTKNKTVRWLQGFSQNGGPDDVELTSGCWYKTDPITSIQFSPAGSSNPFSQYSTFTLIGYK